MPTLYQTPKGQYAGSEKDWRAKMKDEGSDPKLQKNRTVDVPTKKVDLMQFLEFHNINLLFPRQPDAPLATKPESTTMTNEPVAPMTDDQFDALPLAQQLHLAALACENGRSQIKPE